MPPGLNLLRSSSSGTCGSIANYTSSSASAATLSLALRPRLIKTTNTSLQRQTRVGQQPLSLRPGRRFTSSATQRKENEEKAKGPNQDQLPHVSEEARAIGDITGEGGPEIDQGTPVQEILERDKEAQKKAPQVMKEDPSKPKSQYITTPRTSRSFSTLSSRRMPELENASSGTSADTGGDGDRFAAGGVGASSNVHGGEDSASSSSNAPQAAEVKLHQSGIDLEVIKGMRTVAPQGVGTKFGSLEKEMGRTDHFRHRYHPVLEVLTKSMMRSGQLAKAQRNMDIILNHLRSAPPPKPLPSVSPILQSYYNPPETNYVPPHAPKAVVAEAADADLKDRTPTVHPPTLAPQLLPLDPIKYLVLAIDSSSPLVKIRNQRGILGGGRALQIPVPIPLKQRRRTAIRWMLDAAAKRKEIRLADRVAREIVNVMEGRSSVWQKREQVHKLAIAARSNVRFTSRKR